MSHEDTPEHGTQTQRTPQPFGEDGPPPGQARAAPEENSPPANERAKFIRELDGIIGSYRDQTLRKSQAVGAVVRIIENYGGVTEIEKESTLGLYLEEIRSIEVGDSNSTKSDKSSNVDSEDESVDRQSKHSRDEDPSDDDVDKSPRKRRANEKDMPWFNHSTYFIATRRPECKETCRLLRMYHDDIAGSKFLISIAEGAPSGVPSSQWERILRGQAVDLNHILSSLNRVTVDEERKGRLGDSEIIFGAAEAKRTVKTSGDWSSAWRRTSKAISFAFPHRTLELSLYAEYIESEFDAKMVAVHGKIILYDIAIRNEVAGGQNTLLTDSSKFLRLYSAIVMPDGAESGHAGTSAATGKRAGSGGNGKTAGGKTEACYRYNGTSGCEAKDCKFKHVCKACGKNGHGKHQCPT